VHLDLIQPLLLGMKWMDPTWLLSTFGSALFWLSLVIVFVECGLFFPFLPGDTLLFAMGLFIGTDRVDIVPGAHGVDLVVAVILFTIAAFAGNVAGYEIGRKAGPRIYERDGRLLKREYLEQTSHFFEVHGSKALVIGRFVPFVRTYVTLVAGVSEMPRPKFWLWSLVGAALWVTTLVCAGFFLGSAFPGLGSKLDLVILGLLAVSVIPVAYEWWKHRREQAEATS